MEKLQCCGNGINLELLKKFKEQKVHPHIVTPIILNPFTKNGFLKFNRK